MASADYKESFRKGVQALDRKQYAEAAAAFREALQERSQEGGEEVKISGNFFSPYLPYYYLGVALHSLGDCGGAVNAWKESERQGYIARTARMKDLKSSREQCLGPMLAQRYQAGQSEIASAEREQGSFRSLANGTVERQRWKPLADREAKALEFLVLARKKLEEGRQSSNPDLLSEAKGLAADAGKEFRSLREEGSSMIEQWQQAQARSRPSAPEAPRAAPAPSAPVTAAEKRAETPIPAALAPSPVEAPGRRPLPETLITAARAYFSADYPVTVKLLQKASFADPRAAAQASLFRAAARMALYWRGAAQDGALLVAAQKDVRESRRLDPGLRVDARAFSPRFRSFVEQVK
jgi:hypothetical protein